MDKEDVKIIKGTLTTEFGSISIEGDKDLVTEALQNLSTKLTTNNRSNPKKPDYKTNNKTRKTVKAKIVSPTFLSTLVPKENIQELKVFIKGKNPMSHKDIYACSAYWLKNNASVNKVSISEISTVYKILGKRPPTHFEQVFRDAKRDKGLFEQSESVGYYVLTALGETFVEFDLPAVEKDKNGK